MTLEYFCDVFEKFINFHQDKIRKLGFLIYDFDEDGYICELDLYSFIKTYEEDNPDFFMKVYLNDILKMI